MLNRSYVVAMESGLTVRPLHTGKMYTLEECRKRVQEMQETCQTLLKELDYDRFVVYNTRAE